MSKTYTHDDAVNVKKKAFKDLNKVLESFLSKPSPTTPSDIDYTKKVALISKWISQYTNYLQFENKFNPKKNISYSRGDIIFVNFGFNVGAELGGEHYAVVLDKHSDHNSSTLTVIPLTSFKPGKDIHPNDLYLGDELYQKLNLKYKTTHQGLVEQAIQLKLLSNLTTEKINSIENPNDSRQELEALAILANKMERDMASLEIEISYMNKIKEELKSLKSGSIAKIKQITTISKIRIYNPKKSTDPLYGIRYSEDAMKKINEKMKDFYIY